MFSFCFFRKPFRCTHNGRQFEHRQNFVGLGLSAIIIADHPRFFNLLFARALYPFSSAVLFRVESRSTVGRIAVLLEKSGAKRPKKPAILHFFCFFAEPSLIKNQELFFIKKAVFGAKTRALLSIERQKRKKRRKRSARSANVWGIEKTHRILVLIIFTNSSCILKGNAV